MTKRRTTTEDFERALASQGVVPYVFRLYVGGAKANSTRALQRLKELCERYLAGRYHLEVIDVFQQPDLARDDQIVAVPTLIRLSPAPQRKFVGDLTDPERILSALNIPVQDQR